MRALRGAISTDLHALHRTVGRNRDGSNAQVSRSTRSHAGHAGPAAFGCETSCHRTRQPRGHTTQPSPHVRPEISKGAPGNDTWAQAPCEKKCSDPGLSRVLAGHDSLQVVLGRSPLDGGESNVNEQSMHLGDADRGTAWILTTGTTTQFVAT